MRWFRHHIRHNASLALLALAINVALSFGHIHLDDLPGGKVMEGVLISALTSHGDERKDQTQGQTRHTDPDDLCPICMAGAVLGTAVAPSPPVLTVDFAHVVVEQPREAMAWLAQSHRSPFQSRGPPLS